MASLGTTRRARRPGEHRTIDDPRVVCPWAGTAEMAYAANCGNGTPGISFRVNSCFVAGGDWISTKDACALLGVTLRTLYRLIDTGDLPAYKMGRLIRLKRGDVDEYIVRQRMKPGDISAAHKDVDKAMWEWRATQAREIQQRLDLFVVAYRTGRPAPCPICGLTIEASQAADHLVDHR